METSFTFWPKFMAAIDKVPSEADRGRLALAIVTYGTTGVVPELEYPLDMAFGLIRDDIDNSVKARAAGSRGGKGSSGAARRPSAGSRKGASADAARPGGGAGDDAGTPPGQHGEAPCEDSAGTPAEDGEAPCANAASTLAKDCKHPCGDGGSPLPTTGQANTEQYRTVQDSTDIGTNTKRAGAGGAGRYDPASPDFAEPTAEEVAAEAQLRGCGGTDFSGFVDYYAAQGWRKANGQPVRDWRRLLTGWRTSAASRDGAAGKGVSHDFSRFDDPGAPVIDARALVGGAA